MKPSEYKLKLGELLSFMRKTMSNHTYIKHADIYPALEERLPSIKAGANGNVSQVLEALHALALIQRRSLEEGKDLVVYWRLSDSFIKATPHVIMRQLGMIKGNEPKVVQVERVACLPDSGQSPEMEYVVRMGEVLYSEPVKGLDNAREKARELMSIHSQTSAKIFRVDRVIEVSSLF